MVSRTVNFSESWVSCNWMPRRWRSAFGVARPMHSEHFDLAGIGRRESLADLDGGGLSGAVGAEQPEAFAGAHFQIEAVHGDHVFVSLAKLAHAKGGLRGGWGIGIVWQGMGKSASFAFLAASPHTRTDQDVRVSTQQPEGA
jgi:hypothetical protein